MRVDSPFLVFIYLVILVVALLLASSVLCFYYHPYCILGLIIVLGVFSGQYFRMDVGKKAVHQYGISKLRESEVRTPPNVVFVSNEA